MVSQNNKVPNEGVEESKGRSRRRDKMKREKGEFEVIELLVTWNWREVDARA
jgi:hypothetical protein